MQIEIYTREVGCHWVDRVKAILKARGLSCAEIVILSDMTAEEFAAFFLGFKTPPLIVVEGQVLGSYEDVFHWLLESVAA
jgi:glutaredoxin